MRTYPSDVKESGTLSPPYLCLMSADAPPRDYTLQDVFNALRYLAHMGCPQRYLPHDLPP